MKKISRFLYWVPRILSILFILFLALFSLDVFDGNYGFWGTMLALFMHNIPSLILLVVLLIAWRHEWVGGVVYILAGIAFIILTAVRVLHSTPPPGESIGWPAFIIPSLIIAGPALLVGILFFVNWHKKR